MPGKSIIFLRASLLTLFVASLVVFLAMAASNGFSIPWWTVDGGGGTSQGGDYAVSGTIGQPDTSSLMSGGEYIVVGGFWGGGMTPPSPNLVYLPLMIR
jgi:hypothetical protein